ncbi:AMP-binding enzyme [Arcanobacterium hippocoleae]|uniref:AMP-binding enzyme n=1 Tax=Arcanobacterium hippocoleae TaxID=149017 RepID=UPI00333F8FA4
MADRRKEMIINGGFNVYPSEVEKVVREIEGVADVAVIGMPNGTFGESVVAALVLEPGANVTLEQVRQWTESRLSHYAMPKSIAILDELPRSQIGKVLRRSVKEQLENFELVSGQWRKNWELPQIVQLRHLKHISKHSKKKLIALLKSGVLGAKATPRSWSGSAIGGIVKEIHNQPIPVLTIKRTLKVFQWKDL